mmetsp:Transcript_24720/g.54234  ORF Transcript_24720/g.54234 Transcript_24720/m.54234 type:complete len:239 (+) Transcript_24720:275-991(+)
MEGIRTNGKTSTGEFGRFYIGGSGRNETSSRCHVGRRRSLVHAEGLDSPGMHLERQQSAFTASYRVDDATMGVGRLDGRCRARSLGRRRRKRLVCQSARKFAAGVHGLHGGSVRRNRGRKSSGISQEARPRRKDGQQKSSNPVPPSGTVPRRRQGKDNGNRENRLRHAGCIVRRDGKEIPIGASTTRVDRRRSGVDLARRRNGGRTIYFSEYRVPLGASGDCQTRYRRRQSRRLSLRR